MTFRFLPPSPQDERALRFLNAGVVLSSMVMGALFLVPAARGPAAAVLVGALAALYWLFIRAGRDFDRRRKRAQKGAVQLLQTGLRIADFARPERTLPWAQIQHLVVGPGKLEIHHQNGVEVLATREIENAELLISELKRRVRLGNSASDFIPLESL